MAKKPPLYPEGVTLPARTIPTPDQVIAWIKANKKRLSEVEARLKGRFGRRTR